jgi:hypothetical protein
MSSSASHLAGLVPQHEDIDVMLNKVALVIAECNISLKESGNKIASVGGSGTIRGAKAPSASEKFVPAWRVKAEQRYQERKAAEQRKIDESENKVPPWKLKIIRESQAKKRKSDQYWKALTNEDTPENIQQAVCDYFYLPPLPINNGWGRQPHIEAYRRKHTQRKGTGWGPMK